MSMRLTPAPKVAVVTDDDTLAELLIIDIQKI